LAADGADGGRSGGGRGEGGQRRGDGGGQTWAILARTRRSGRGRQAGDARGDWRAIRSRGAIGEARGRGDEGGDWASFLIRGALGPRGRATREKKSWVRIGRGRVAGGWARLREGGRGREGGDRLGPGEGGATTMAAGFAAPSEAGENQLFSIRRSGDGGGAGDDSDWRFEGARARDGELAGGDWARRLARALNWERETAGEAGRWGRRSGRGRGRREIGQEEMGVRTDSRGERLGGGDYRRWRERLAMATIDD